MESHHMEVHMTHFSKNVYNSNLEDLAKHLESYERQEAYRILLILSPAKELLGNRILFKSEIATLVQLVAR
jgi:hypothetical protein